MPTIPTKVNNYTCIFSKNMILYIPLICRHIGKISTKYIPFAVNFHGFRMT